MSENKKCTIFLPKFTDSVKSIQMPGGGGGGVGGSGPWTSDELLVCIIIHCPDEETHL